MTPDADREIDLIRVFGPGGFATERHYLEAGEHRVWRSREHRRGLRPGAHAGWRPERLNPWIGGGFAVGSALFAAGALLVLRPGIAAAFGLTEAQINLGFFIGSIFFTVAGYLQLYQAANVAPPPGASASPAGRVLIGWRPKEIGWLASFLQFIGTVLFNISTLATLHPSGNWLRDELTIWGPDVFGSVLFLSSGYLAFAEASHGYWSWRPGQFTWWLVVINLGGCVAFMISAIYAFVPPSGASDAMTTHAVAWTMWGALCFLAGALMMLGEGSATTS